MTPEKAVQNQIIEYLHKLEKHGHEIYCERRQAGGFSYKMGIADLYAVFSGWHVEIEIKAKGGSMRPMQERWRDRCHELKILWICINDVEELKRFIDETFITKLKDGKICYQRKEEEFN